MLNDFLVEISIKEPLFFPTLMVVLGGVFGSFLTCMVYRVPHGIGLSQPPSHCPSCKTRLGVPDLIPVLSWVMFAGKCRHCGVKIPVRYVLIEILTVFLFLGCWYLIGADFRLFIALAALIGTEFTLLLFLLFHQTSWKVLLFSCMIWGVFIFIG